MCDAAGRNEAHPPALPAPSSQGVETTWPLLHADVDLLRSQCTRTKETPFVREWMSVMRATAIGGMCVGGWGLQTLLYLISPPTPLFPVVSCDRYM